MTANINRQHWTARVDPSLVVSEFKKKNSIGLVNSSAVNAQGPPFRKSPIKKAGFGQRNFSLPIFTSCSSVESLHKDTKKAIDNYCTNYINQVIEEGLESVDLSCLSLDILPEAIFDLKYLTSSSFMGQSAANHTFQSKLSLYLQGNLLTDLPQRFYQLTNLTVLSLSKQIAYVLQDHHPQRVLGNNNMTALSSAIKKLSHLKELSLGGNHFKWLPAEIKNLPISVLMPLPNPFYTKNECDTLNGQVDFQQLTLSLEEYTMRNILSQIRRARNMGDPLLVKGILARLPQHLAHLLEQRVGIDLDCSICQKPIYRQYVSLFRTETLLKEYSGIPLQYHICSLPCYEDFMGMALLL